MDSFSHFSSYAALSTIGKFVFPDWVPLPFINSRVVNEVMLYNSLACFVARLVQPILGVIEIDSAEMYERKCCVYTVISLTFYAYGVYQICNEILQGNFDVNSAGLAIAIGTSISPSTHVAYEYASKATQIRNSYSQQQFRLDYDSKFW